MYKKVSFLILCMIILFSISCQRKSKSIEEDYLREIESEYRPTDSAKTNYDSTIEVETPNMAGTSTNTYTPTTNRTIKTNKTVDESKVRKLTPYKTTAYKPVSRSATKYTINNFDTAWTSKSDPTIIKELRVMIANREYQKARVYIDKLDFSNLPAGVDAGQLYQFKGIIYYFLVPSSPVALAASEQSFEQVLALTKIEKFKPLSLLWNAMLYQKYSKDEVQLNEAIALLDRVITEYPRTRFVNDAVYYKALTLKKLGRPASEYTGLLNSIKTGEYVDNLIFSQTVNDYVKSTVLVK